jgi:hypothetical protein
LSAETLSTRHHFYKDFWQFWSGTAIAYKSRWSLRLHRATLNLNGGTMDRPVGEHIKNLEQRQLLLSAWLMNEDDSVERNRLESELRAVESALALYRSALEVEHRIPRVSFQA